MYTFQALTMGGGGGGGGRNDGKKIIGEMTEN